MRKHKIYYCERLEDTINFQPDIIKYCCNCALGLGINIEQNTIINFKEFLTKRNHYINEIKKGNIPQNCVNCVELQEKEIKKENIITKFFKKKKETKIIKQIFVNHFKQCDCRCIYCSQEFHYDFSTERYELVPILEELYKNNLIDENNLKVEFQGGNVSVLKEFNDIIRTLIKNGCKNYTILTNGIKYLDVVHEIPKENTQIYFVISLDSGTNETYKKIKQVDAFEKVINNIYNYCNNVPNIRIVLKYIIINGVNDNKFELNNFLNIAQNIKNLHAITIEIDYRNTFMSQEEHVFKIPKHYYELYNYAEEYCKNNNIFLDNTAYTKKILAEGKAYSTIRPSQKD